MIRPELVFKSIYPEGSERPRILHWQVDEKLPYFQGHFPQNPILPAIAIIDASTYILQRALDQDQLRLKAVTNAKFLSPISPGRKVRIELQQLGEGDWQIDWKEEASAQLLATLRVEL